MKLFFEKYLKENKILFVSNISYYMNDEDVKDLANDPHDKNEIELLKRDISRSLPKKFVQRVENDLTKPEVANLITDKIGWIARDFNYEVKTSFDPFKEFNFIKPDEYYTIFYDYPISAIGPFDNPESAYEECKQLDKRIPGIHFDVMSGAELKEFITSDETSIDFYN